MVDSPVLLTAGLLEGLLLAAKEAEPTSISLALGTTPASEFPSLPSDIEADAAILTHYYHPDAGRANRAVFGVDLSISPGQVDGRFLSHPAGERSVNNTDDLNEVVFVAVPPWTTDDVRAFDRYGHRLDYRVISVDPPEETLP